MTDHEQAPGDLPPEQPPTQQMGAVPPPDPPAATTPVQAGPPPKDPWPSSAKGTVVALGVLVIAAVIAAVIGFAQASSSDDDADRADEELVAAIARADAAEAALAELEGSMEAELESLREERNAALLEVEALEADITELESSVAELTEENENLQALVEAGVETFPVTVAPDLPTADLEGQYSITFSEVRCDGLEQCGALPTLPNVSIARAGGALLLNVPGQFEINLTGRSAQLFGVTQDETIIDPCAEEPRPQLTRITIGGAVSEVGLSGEVRVTGLTASVIVEAPAFGDCAAGEAWYGATLTRLG